MICDAIIGLAELVLIHNYHTPSSSSVKVGSACDRRQPSGVSSVTNKDAEIVARVGRGLLAVLARDS